MALDAVTRAVEVPEYRQSRNNQRNVDVAQQQPKQQQIQESREPLLIPVSTRRSASRPNLGTEQQQRDAALLVSHRQRDWRREHHRSGPEQTVVRSPIELYKDLPSYAPRREETPAQKPERSRGVRYSR
jgi:hypothetical protein